jgi:hypothetical protein
VCSDCGIGMLQNEGERGGFFWTLHVDPESTTRESSRVAGGV